MKDLLCSRKVLISHGQEGPHYDPYAYTEFLVEEHRQTEDGKSYRFSLQIHQGLRTEVFLVLGSFFEYKLDLQKSSDMKTFEDLVGSTYEQYISNLHRYLNHKRLACTCGSHNLAWINGYPGETLLVCTDCTRVCDYEFDISAVM